jgi:hypothetical protein
VIGVVDTVSDAVRPGSGEEDPGCVSGAVRGFEDTSSVGVENDSCDAVDSSASEDGIQSTCSGVETLSIGASTSTPPSL